MGWTEFLQLRTMVNSGAFFVGFVVDTVAPRLVILYTCNRVLLSVPFTLILIIIIHYLTDVQWDR